MAQNNIINYYTMFGIDRSLTEKEIKKLLSRRQADLSRMQGSTSRDDFETLKELQEAMEYLRQAIKALVKPENRKKYDVELDAAIKAGSVNTKVEAEVQNLLERAKKLFSEGQYAEARDAAKAVIDSGNVSEEPYLIMERSDFLLGNYDEALKESVANAKAFSSSVNMNWQAIRYMIMMEEYSRAQEALNIAKEAFPGNPIIQAEQIYLYGHAEKYELMYTEIDNYMKANPTDMDYRKIVAYNLIELSRFCYVVDQSAEAFLLLEEEDYNRARELVEKANELYQDEVTESELAYVRQFGEMVDDTGARNNVKPIYILGIVLIVFGIGFPLLLVIGVLLIVAGVVVGKKVNKIPYWRAYRNEIRGFRDADDTASGNILWTIAEFIRSIGEAFTR